MRRWWAAFWLLGLIWGSSFLLIRIGVDEIPALELVFIRVVIAALGLNAALRLTGRHLPTDRQTLGILALIGVGNTVIPFTLITLGEKSIDSGIAAVLQATAALFTFPLAHFAFADERLSPAKAGGLVVGFGGVVLLASRSWQDGGIVTGSLFGQLAIVAASLFYAIFNTYSRKVIRSRLEPLVLSTGALTAAAVVMAPLMVAAPLFGERAPVLPGEFSRGALVSALLLGVLNTFIAYMLYYSIIKHLGSARASMVTYVIPPVGLVLGVLFRDERLDARLILGAILILSGIGIVNLGRTRLRRAGGGARPAAHTVEA